MNRSALTAAVRAGLILVATAGPSAQEPQPSPSERSAPASGASASEKATSERRHVRWQDWDRTTFELAMALKRPVLLYLRSEACRLCVSLEAGALDDPQVVEAIRDLVVPVAVDVDRRPDLGRRYLVGTVPTLTFLLPDAEPMYRIGELSSLRRVAAYTEDASQLRGFISTAATYLREHALDLHRKAQEVADLESKVRNYLPGAVPSDRVAEAIDRIREGFDFQYGGSVERPRLVDDAPYRLFHVLTSARGEAALGRAVVSAAERMLDSPIYDRVDGGFHHYSMARDWSSPALEKHLEGNGRALRLLTEAMALAPDPSRLGREAGRTADFLLHTLSLPGGAFALAQSGSLNAEDPGHYFSVGAAERQTLKPPPVQKLVVADANARAAAALIEAAGTLRRPDLEAAGLAAVDFLSTRLYERGRGVSHYLREDGLARLPGLLADQAAALEALLLAYQARAEPSDLERAEDVFHFCLANLKSEAGHFIDRIEDPAAMGMLRRAQISLGDNGRMALAGYRLAALTGDESYRRAADAALGALARGIPKLRSDDAPFAEALLAQAERPLRILVVEPATAGSAPRSGVATDPLLAAASRLPFPGAVAVRLRSGSTWAGQKGMRLPGGGEASGAYACSGSECVGPILEPKDLLQAVESARQRRSAG